MAFTDDIATDFQEVADGLETITLRDRDHQDTSVSYALRRAVSRREIEPSNGYLRLGDVRWHFPKAQVTSEPKLGEKIIASDGTKWTVLAVGEQTLTHRYALDTRNLEVEAGINTTLHIQVASYTQGDSGAAEATWSDYQIVSGRVQPQQGVIAFEHEQAMVDVDVRITLADQLTFDPSRSYRVCDFDKSNCYSLTGYQSPERIDQLPVILAVKTPWPFA